MLAIIAADFIVSIGVWRSKLINDSFTVPVRGSTIVNRF